jgi:hypothetical protein
MQRFGDLLPSCTSFVNASRLPYLKTLVLATIPVMLAAVTVLVVRDALADGAHRNSTATTRESSPLTVRP